MRMSRIQTGVAKGCPGLIQFDLDGTLVNTYEVILRSMRYTINECFGGTYSDEQLMSEVGIPLITQLEHYCPEDPQRALQIFRDYQAKLPKELNTLYQGIEECLHQLKAEGYKLAVVTSKHREAALENLNDTGIMPYFDLVVAADDVIRAKPDPYPVIHTAHELQVPIQQVVYVGDSPFDLQAANAAGAFSIAVLWGMFGRTALEREQPSAFAEHSDELIGLIHQMTGRL